MAILTDKEPNQVKTLLFFLFIIVSKCIFSQENSLLEGIVLDNNQTPLYGVKVVVSSLNKGAISNDKGEFSFSIPNGSHDVEFRLQGHVTKTILVNLHNDTTIRVQIGEALQEIEEVEVNANALDNTESTDIGQLKLDIDEIRKVPQFMGEVDIIKTIQLLPGISSAAEGGQGFYVRGGGPDQNLVLVDGATVYNASHLFGFFSVFNADAVEDVNLIKGNMPAQFGGRMSSVLEVGMKEGSEKKFGVKGGLGVISSRLTVHGPLKKDKGGFSVSARRTYIDMLMKVAIPKSSSFYGSSYFFYDLNFKAHYKLSPKDKIYLTGYYGKDKFVFNSGDNDFNVEMPWGNGIGSLRWQHLMGKKIIMNTTATFTDYQFSFGSNQDEFSFALSSGVRDWGGKVDFTWIQSPRQKIRWGAQYTHHTFIPMSVAAESKETVFDTGDPQKLRSHESALYFSDAFELTEDIKFEAGLRYSMFHHVGPFTRYIKGGVGSQDSTVNYNKGDIIKFYHGLEPRFAFRWMLKDKSSFKAGFSYNYQYVHLTSMSAVSLPTDIWYPATSLAKPQTGYQASIGYFRNFLNNKIETSVEVYYKGMNNLVEYKEGALPGDNINDNTDNLLAFGKGWSYGIELFVKKSIGNFTGWIGYTWSKTERKFPTINEGKIFAAKYDRRHDLSVVASYQIKKS